MTAMSVSLGCDLNVDLVRSSVIVERPGSLKHRPITQT